MKADAAMNEPITLSSLLLLVACLSVALPVVAMAWAVTVWRMRA